MKCSALVSVGRSVGWLVGGWLVGWLGSLDCV